MPANTPKLGERKFPPFFPTMHGGNMAHELVRWNTGRPYTKHGQIIVAQLQDDGSVLFADLSRMIDGHIEPSAWLNILDMTNGHTLRSYVMNAYDNNRHNWDLQSRAFFNEMHKLNMHKTIDGEYVS